MIGLAVWAVLFGTLNGFAAAPDSGAQSLALDSAGEQAEIIGSNFKTVARFKTAPGPASVVPSQTDRGYLLLCRGNFTITKKIKSAGTIMSLGPDLKPNGRRFDLPGAVTQDFYLQDRGIWIIVTTVDNGQMQGRIVVFDLKSETGKVFDLNSPAVSYQFDPGRKQLAVGTLGGKTGGPELVLLNLANLQVKSFPVGLNPVAYFSGPETLMVVAGGFRKGQPYPEGMLVAKTETVTPANVTFINLATGATSQTELGISPVVVLQDRANPAVYYLSASYMAPAAPATQSTPGKPQVNKANQTEEPETQTFNFFLSDWLKKLNESQQTQAEQKPEDAKAADAKAKQPKTEPISVVYQFQGDQLLAKTELPIESFQMTQAANGNLCVTSRDYLALLSHELKLLSVTDFELKVDEVLTNGSTGYVSIINSNFINVFDLTTGRRVEQLKIANSMFGSISLGKQGPGELPPVGAIPELSDDKTLGAFKNSRLFMTADPSRIYALSNGSALVTIDSSSRRILNTLKIGGTLVGMHPTPNGRFIVVTTDSDCYLVDPTQKRPALRVQLARPGLSSSLNNPVLPTYAYYSPDGRWLTITSWGSRYVVDTLDATLVTSSATVGDTPVVVWPVR